MKNNILYLKIILLSAILSSCQSTVDRLKRVGQHPEFTKLRVPDTSGHKNHKQEVNPDYQDKVKRTNSLWQPGSTTFFNDNRSWQVGDILKVVVQITDKANLDNNTNQGSKNKDNISLDNLMGKEKAVRQIFSSSNEATDLVKSNSDRAYVGGGTVKRKEDIKTAIAATVMQVLNNGNLVIQGHQEVRVNYELREVKVAGIVRPQDIKADNSVNSDQIAEARISYGGRGIISDVQKKPVVSEILDVVSPF